MLNEALKYIRRGFAVVPLRPGEKIPALKNFTNEPLDTEEKALLYWRNNPQAGVGILIGEKSGLIAVDVDCNHGATVDDLKLFPRTVTVKTKNGYHLYYKHPRRGIENKALLSPLLGKTKTQARAFLWTDKHQFVAPPTVVIDDNKQAWEYRFHSDAGGETSFADCPIAECPTEWLALPQTLDVVTASLVPDKPNLIDERLLLNACPTSRRTYGQNERHDMFTRTAVAMASKGKDFQTIVDELLLRNERDCKPPKTDKDNVKQELSNLAKWAVEHVQASVTTAEVIETSSRPADSSEDNIQWASFPDETDKGRRLGTYRNVKELIHRLGIVVRYNVMSKEEEILIPGQSYSLDNRANASFGYITDWSVRVGIPTGNLISYLTMIADETQYHPVVSWVRSKQWDGQSRLQDLFDTLESPEKKLKELLMRKWLVSVMAAVFEPNGISAHGILVLQGAQSIGKTTWISRLLPPELEAIKDGLILRPDDKDSVSRCIRYTIVELGELDATFSKTDIAQLKGFSTSDRDVIRRPYSIRESTYPRRTVLCASVNEPSFLNDPTGNRRFWTIPCTAIDYEHKIDMQQLWAEVHALYAKGERWHLSSDEMRQLNDSNEQFTSIDPIDEKINTEYQWQLDRSQWGRLTASEVLAEIGWLKPSVKDCRAAGRVLRKMSGAPRQSGCNLLFDVPPRVDQMERLPRLDSLITSKHRPTPRNH